MYDRSQLMRGSLEGSILMIVARDISYGYEIMSTLRSYGFHDVSEGTIYPILLRLEKQGNIKSTLRPSPLGPKRKYYEITETGKAYLQAFQETWIEVTGIVAHIMEDQEKKKGEDA